MLRYCAIREKPIRVLDLTSLMSDEFETTVVTNCPIITVTNPATSTGTAGTAFSQSFTQTGGAGTVTFSLASGRVSPWLPSWWN